MWSSAPSSSRHPATRKARAAISALARLDVSSADAGAVGCAPPARPTRRWPTDGTIRRRRSSLLLEYAPTRCRSQRASGRTCSLPCASVGAARPHRSSRRCGAVEALGFLLGADGPVGLVPPNPPDGMFDMLLRTSLFVIEPGDPAVGRLVTSLATVIGLPGWTVRVSVFVHRLCRAGRIDEHAASAIGPVAQRVGIELVEACDRGAATTPRLTSEAAMFSGSSDLARRDRARIVPLLALAGEAQHLLGRDPASRFVLRALSSADPRVAAMAAVVLVRHGGLVGHDRLSVIALDAHARAELSRRPGRTRPE